MRDWWRGLRNLWSYAPIIWRDRDWDQAYLYELLHFKLKRMESCLRAGGHVHASRDAAQIRVAAACLKRVMDDDYWPAAAFDYGWKDLSHDQRKRIMDHEHCLRRQDLRYFGRLFEKYSQGWWD